MSPTGKGLVVRIADAKLGIASCGPVFITVVRSLVDMPLVRVMAREVEAHAATCGGVYSTMSVIEPAAAHVQDRESRDAAALIGQQFQVLHSAIVAEGEGFKATAVRMALSAMYLIKPPKYPYKIFSDTAQGARWLVENGAGPAKEEILEAIAAVRSAR